MQILEFPDNPRLPILTELVSQLSQATDPSDVIRAFGAGWGKLAGQRGYISLSCRGLKPGAYRITRLYHHIDIEQTDRVDARRISTTGLASL